MRHQADTLPEPLGLGYRPLMGFVAALSAAAPQFASAALCAAGTLSATGTDATGCTPAPAGYFVNISGATQATPAAPGSYVGLPGQTAATLAPLGTYVPNAAATAPTPAPVGRYVPIVGSTVALPANLGTYVGTTGASVATLAPAGTYVGVTGASAPTQAPPGTFVSGVGAAVATPAPPGSYVSGFGASQATLAPPGTFVPTPGATAPIPASPGSYVQAAGSTTQTLATPGHYVPNAGASTQTLASPGYFVANSGATSQTPAPAGYYLPIAGATSAGQAIPASAGFFAASGSATQTAAPEGFYTYATGASRPVPAGLVAAPMNAAMLAVDAGWTNLSELLGRRAGAPIMASIYYQSGRVSQAGQSSGSDTDNHASALNLAAAVFGSADSPAGVTLNASHASMSASSDGSGKTSGFQLGVFKRLALEHGEASAQLAAGTFNFDTDRQNVSQGLIGGVAANSQSTTASGHVTVAALNLALSRELSSSLPNLEFVGRASLARYRFGGIDETGSGAQGDPSAALSAKSRNLLSMPLTLGLRYRFAAAAPALAPTLMVGYRFDAAGKKSIDISPQGAPAVGASVPIAMSGASGFVFELNSPGYTLAKTVSIDASLHAATGSRYSYLQGTLTLTKSF